MRFRRLWTNHFRNLESQWIDLDAQEVILVGANGQGKTNLLEALYTLCYGSSFRTAQLRELAQNGQKEFKLVALYGDEEALEHTLELEYKESKRSVILDGKLIKDRKHLIYNIPCIVFSHDDIAFVRGEPEARRLFFDQTMSMYNPLFFDDLRRYRQILRQRNLAIKEGRDSLLPIYDQQLARHGISIQAERTATTARFNEIFPPLYREISGDEVNIEVSYTPSWRNCATEEEVATYLANHRDRDRVMNTTTSGIHRDRFVITCDGQPFSQIGSTGQLRLASLVLRSAQMAFYETMTTKKPVILVDDVLLELDHQKRERFLANLKPYSQAFFTFLPDEHYSSSLQGQKSLLYTVAEGRFEGGQG
ncbi:MAG: DNA replication and repair protein RecF [Sphaerochaeta sp.]|jgi:DNA replication and repair protein RecF